MNNDNENLIPLDAEDVLGFVYGHGCKRQYGSGALAALNDDLPLPPAVKEAWAEDLRDAAAALIEAADNVESQDDCTEAEFRKHMDEGWAWRRKPSRDEMGSAFRAGGLDRLCVPFVEKHGVAALVDLIEIAKREKAQPTEAEAGAQ